MIPGHLCATLAAGGSLSRRRSRVSVVFMVVPFGMDSDLASYWSLARRAVARAVRRVMDAPESIRAVLFMLVCFVTTARARLSMAVSMSSCIPSLSSALLAPKFLSSVVILSMAFLLARAVRNNSCCFPHPHKLLGLSKGHYVGLSTLGGQSLH